MVMANRLPLRERRKRWVGCFKVLSCFGTKKGERRIVPASRIPEGNVATGRHHQSNQPQSTTGLSNQATSMLAPPSSPASFSHSAAPSTMQSPNCQLSLSANSPGGPSSAMFATGPYAHETQLVSPPVFSTYTTEPSTAPLTPPPELAHHLTTPSSPEVPYARFLTSSTADLKKTEKGVYVSANDLHATYALYPGSPASGLRSPISRTLGGDGRCSSFPERDFLPQWDPLASPRSGKCSRSDSTYAQTPETNNTPKASQGSNFFCPDTFARYYLDHDAPFSQTGGRLSVSKDSDVYPTSGNGQRISKHDMEELEAYRASFGFSADEVIATSQYVEITHLNDGSFTMRPRSALDATSPNCNIKAASEGEGLNFYCSEANLDLQKSEDNRSNLQEPLEFYNADHMQRQLEHISVSSTPGNGGQAKTSRKYKMGLCSSDAEIDYRRSGRSKGDFVWHD
ncbi:PREDICTED: uncharacterized protein At1g76660-like isoform X3 [Camelina sativa]|uniref:Uncharacterized protein At1g76660-like isoform X3 n=1 Tax=Camelina sativa TaxID=90675 RepID=A0ABM0X0X1_CAMSA|nr:PREDICTED: uncharacterized protein At1g76660-like isoform X3 [Camelina sativa]